MCESVCVRKRRGGKKEEREREGGVGERGKEREREREGGERERKNTIHIEKPGFCTYKKSRGQNLYLLIGR